VKDANAHKGEFPPKVRLVEYGSKEAMLICPTLTIG